MGRPGGVCERDVVQSLRHAGRGKRALERRGERPETGASGGSAAADHGAERRDGHGAGHSAHLPDTAERQTAGDGVSRWVHGRGIVRLQRRADDGGPDGPCDDGTASSTEQKIDLNTADVSQLTTLTGVGESKALAIIAYREENGPFTSAEDIMNVPGIKEGTYEKIKDKIAIK